MMSISSAVRTGAMAFLKREFKIVIPIAIALTIIISFTSGVSNGIAFAVGAAMSGLSGLLSLRITVKGSCKGGSSYFSWVRPCFCHCLQRRSHSRVIRARNGLNRYHGSLPSVS